jgi:hypothetical protein
MQMSLIKAILEEYVREMIFKGKDRIHTNICCSSPMVES